MSNNGQEYTMEKGTYRVVDGELVRIVDIDEVEKMLALHKDILISKGWTPPPEKPEFKEGDYVMGTNRYLFKVKKILGGLLYNAYGTTWRINECRHAPTWINWQYGMPPSNDNVQGYVRYSDDEKQYVVMNDGRWAWI